MSARFTDALGFGSGRLVENILAELGDGGRVLVFGERLARQLVLAGREVVEVALAPVKRRKSRTLVARSLTELPFGDQTLEGVCANGEQFIDLGVLRELARVLTDGAPLILVCESPLLGQRVSSPGAVAGLLLHAGVRDIEQRRVGSTLLSCGRRSSPLLRPPSRGY